MSLVELLAELLFAVAEHVFWDLETGWDACRLLPFAQSCRHVASSVKPLLGSSVPYNSARALNNAVESMQQAREHLRLRSFANKLHFHSCDPYYCRGALDDTYCIVPAVALYQHTLVHLDLYEPMEKFPYNLASTVNGFPRLRFLRVGSYEPEASLSIGAIVTVVQKCPSLETLIIIQLRFGHTELIPSTKAPFRLRYLRLEHESDASAFMHGFAARLWAHSNISTINLLRVIWKP